MAFITRCWQKRGAEVSARLRHALIWGAAFTFVVLGWAQTTTAQAAPAVSGAAEDQAAVEAVSNPAPAPVASPTPAALNPPPLPAVARASQAPTVSALQLRRQGDALELGVRLRFDLPEPVRDALYKGLSVIFTAEVEIYRERWWWLDTRVSRAQRQWRLVYQPLTQRWRLSVGAASAARAGNAALAQTFDSLEEALAVIQHITQWRVADWSALEAEDDHRIEFHFHLDTDKLPRPLQIGALGDDGWELDLNRQRTFTVERLD
ncbi:DUF4390 domain-containing protein [Hylemonella sp. W303a]|uniref:DUF4390 domain-containing protein n=1 Tax=Hylemonella sp. W303a TaxID=3389873 RepID=UPI00396AF85D